MNQRTLVTTPIQDTWPSLDQPVLFLGEWCKLFKDKKVFDKYDSKVAYYHWNDRDKLYQDYCRELWSVTSIFLVINDMLVAVKINKDTISCIREAVLRLKDITLGIDERYKSYPKSSHFVLAGQLINSQQDVLDCLNPRPKESREQDGLHEPLIKPWLYLI